MEAGAPLMNELDIPQCLIMLSAGGCKQLEFLGRRILSFS
jgi:hypothetical protein